MGAVYLLLARKESLLGISLFLLIVPVVTTLVWGRIFCGWLCPAGAVQEFVYLEGTSAKPVGQLPARVDHMLKPVKIIMLATIGYLTWQSGINIWGHYEPFKTLFNFQGAPLTLSFLGVTLLISLLVERPFCRYICPLGAILSLVARFSRYKLKIDEGLCKGCGSCAKINCPTGALEFCSKKESSPRIDNAECIRCLRCIESCRHGALS
jgi:polyferredoxin